MVLLATVSPALRDLSHATATLLLAKRAGGKAVRAHSPPPY